MCKFLTKNNDGYYICDSIANVKINLSYLIFLLEKKNIDLHPQGLPCSSIFDVIFRGKELVFGALQAMILHELYFARTL